MKVCWFGLYKDTYSRNRVLIDGLQAQGVEVIECKASYKRPYKHLHLLRQLLALRNNYDVLYCAFPVNWTILIAYLFQRKPIVVDAFFPMYDAHVKDRKSVGRYSLKALLYRLQDYLCVRLADMVVVDTQAHAHYWRDVYDHKHMVVVPVGSDDSVFFPIKTAAKSSKCEVVFQGTFIPLQGVEKIVGAADLLRQRPDIHFTFIGEGQTLPAIRERIKAKKLEITFVPMLPLAQLNQRINQADILLGVFGDSSKTDRVIPNKVWQAAAVAKPMITKNTPAIRECFTENELILIDNTPAAIATAITDLVDDTEKRELVAKQAHALYTRDFAVAQIGAQLKNHLQECVDRS